MVAALLLRLRPQRGYKLANQHQGLIQTVQIRANYLSLGPVDVVRHMGGSTLQSDG